MASFRFTDRFKTLYQQAVRLSESSESDAVMFLLEDGPIDWTRLRNLGAEEKVIISAESESILTGAKEAGFDTVVVDMPDSSVHDRLSRSLLEAVADDILHPGACVTAIYSGFEADVIDSVTLIQLGEHLDRLTGRDLRQLETQVPLETLKTVVDLATEIGREGREGKPVGTLFVVGDTKNVMKMTSPLGFDPVRGYSQKERDLSDPRVREGVKEIAQLDGAIVVSASGIVVATCQHLNAQTSVLTLSKGLGARHWAAAAISKATKAIAITVSQSNGSVRIFLRGETMLRVEPVHRRPMIWRDFDYDPSVADTKPKPATAAGVATDTKPKPATSAGVATDTKPKPDAKGDGRPKTAIPLPPSEL